MSTKFDKYVQLYNKITDGESIVPESREEAFDLALVMKLKGVSSDESILNSKSKLSKYMNLYKDIINGEDIVPETREEAIKLALIRSHGNGGGGTGGSVDLSNYYRKSQTYSRTEVDSKLETKANSTDVYSKTETEGLLGNKIDKVDGKGLSQENYTTEEKTKVAGLKNYDDTALSGRVASIEGDYANKTYVGEQIANIDKLTRKIVTVLPTADEATDDIIYMLKMTDSSGDMYEMYMKIEGNVVLIGTTTVDLTGYAKTSDLPTKTSDLNNDSGFLTEHQDISGKVDKIAGKGLSENDFTDTLKADYDNAASKAHSHSNSSVLDKFSEDISGNPLYNGASIAGGLSEDLKTTYDAAAEKAHEHTNKTVLDNVTQEVIDNSHTHANTDILNKFSEDYSGSPLYNGFSIVGASGEENQIYKSYIDNLPYAKKGYSSGAEPGYLRQYNKPNKICFIGNSITAHGRREEDGIEWTVDDMREMAASKPNSGWVSLIQQYITKHINPYCKVYKANGSIWETQDEGSRDYSVMADTTAYEVTTDGTVSVEGLTIDTMLTEDTDIVIIQLSENMSVNSTDLSDSTKDFVNLYKSIRSKCPKARIYQFLGVWPVLSKLYSMVCACVIENVEPIFAPMFIDGYNTAFAVQFKAIQGDSIYDAEGNQIATVSSAVAGHPNDIGFMNMAICTLDALFNNRSAMNYQKRPVYSCVKFDSTGEFMGSVDDPYEVEMFNCSTVSTISDFNSKYKELLSYFILSGYYAVTLTFPNESANHGILNAKIRSSDNGYMPVIQDVESANAISKLRSVTTLSNVNTVLSNFSRIL